MTLFSKRFWLWIVLSLLASSCAFSQSQPDGGNKRRVLTRPAPAYPSLARSMALSGVVRVEAVVSPDGSVKAVAVKGGHPVLAQTVVNAVRSWKWEAAQHESHEVVEVKFSPE
jgi:TonB family protein